MEEKDFSEEVYIDPYKTQPHLLRGEVAVHPAYIWNIIRLGGVYLAGGAIRAVYDKTTVDDYDIFFREEKTQEDSLAKVSQVEKEILKAGFEETFRCPLGELTNFIHQESKTKVQLLTPMFYQDLETLLLEFDITASMFGIGEEESGLTFLAGACAIRDAKTMEIRFNRLYYPESSLGRIIKYTEKGYKLKGFGKLEFMERIREGDPRADIRLYLD